MLENYGMGNWENKIEESYFICECENIENYPKYSKTLLKKMKQIWIAIDKKAKQILMVRYEFAARADNLRT